MKATGGTRERDYPAYLPTLPPSPRIITMVMMILLLTETADSEERREAREGVDRASCARSICTSRGYLPS